MTEFFRQIILSWYVLPGCVMAIVMFGALALAFKALMERDAARRHLLCEMARAGKDIKALRELNHEFEREIASLKDDKPKPERLKPVIDWIALNAVYVDYDADSRELEVGWINKDGIGTTTLHDLSEQQARELGEDFKIAIRSNHQPARFA